MSIIQALAMTIAEIPVFLYTTFGQVNKRKHLERAEILSNDLQLRRLAEAHGVGLFKEPRVILHAILKSRGMSDGKVVLFCFLLLLKSAFSALRVTPGLRKVLFATALGTVALALTAHQLKRRRRKKRIAPEKSSAKPAVVPVPILPTRRAPSVKKGDCDQRLLFD